MRREDFDYPALVRPAPRDRLPRARPYLWFIAGCATTLAVLAVAGVLP